MRLLEPTPATHPFADPSALELVARILAGPSARPPDLDPARALLHRFGDLRGLLAASTPALVHRGGLAPEVATLLSAALQAGARAVQPRPTPATVLTSPAQAAALLQPRLMGQAQEELHALALSNRRSLLAWGVLTVGSDRHTIVDPRQVYRFALEVGATGLVVAHNHPSGCPEPSAADQHVTRRLAEVGALVGVALLDHIIVAGEGWVSLAERGVIPDARPPPVSWATDTASAPQLRGEAPDPLRLADDDQHVPGLDLRLGGRHDHHVPVGPADRDHQHPLLPSDRHVPE